jgi:hypothetical protein
VKYIKKFETLSDDLFKYLDDWKLKYGHDYKIENDDVTFYEDVDLSNYKMPDGIFPIKLKSSHALILKNCGLKSFKNFPEAVYGDIDVRNNYIKNFEYFPERMPKATLYCSYNPLESLIGIPVEMMYENRVKYGDVSREILDEYWQHQLDIDEIGIDMSHPLIKNLIISRNTIKTNSVGPKSEIAQYMNGFTRGKKVDLWDLNT